MASRVFRQTREQVSESIRSTLERESRGFEVLYAYWRVAVIAGVACLNTATIRWPWIQALERLPPVNVLINAAMLAIAIAVLLLVRRGWYPPGITLLSPAIDAAAVFYVYGVVLATSEPPLFGLGMEDVAVYSALIALSGGLRLYPISAAFSTSSALLSFAALTLASNEAIVVHAPALVAIVVAGLAGYGLTTIVRASLQGEVSRTIFRRFLPEHLVEQARHDPLAIVEEPRVLVATVLFTDLRDFTALAEAMPPGEVLDHLSELQGQLADIVTKHGGTVDTFIGDGMLAVFGAPRVSRDHAQQGIAAAIEIISSMAAVNLGRRERGQPASDISLALHTGPVVAGCLGSGSRLQFTVIGDAVNATSRLEGLTKQLGVTALVSEDTIRFAGYETAALTTWLTGRWTHRGELSLRGRTAPLSVYSFDT